MSEFRICPEKVDLCQISVTSDEKVEAFDHNERDGMHSP